MEQGALTLHHQVPFPVASSWAGSGHDTTVIPQSHQHPSGIPAHPKALLNPGSWEHTAGVCMAGHSMAEGEGTPGHLLWVMEVGHGCDLGHHHHVGCSLPEGVCVPRSEELCGNSCE